MTDGTYWKPGLGDYFAAVYRTGNHASVEGFVPPTDNGIHRLAHTEVSRDV